ncbi:UNVERIFIED_CONTAM: DivIVA domain-containing protein [Kocuria sp. CPCC 205316]|jgi:DivIVA domain-containing protein|uniref:DivIVA domain-containing protein n=1 Tax=Kocuria TaxID=57493 RepID=UPI0036DD9DE6
MTELLVVLSGLVLLLTVVGVVVLGRDRLADRVAPARDGIAVGRAPDAPLVLPEHPTAEDLERIAFSVRRRGYDPAEVHAVLAHLADRLPPPPEDPPSRTVPGA